VDGTTIEKWIETAKSWVLDNVLETSNFVQLGTIVAAYLIALPLGPRLRGAVAGLRERLGRRDWLDQLLGTIEDLATLLAWLAIQWIILLIALSAELDNDVMEIAVSLLTAWVVIRFASTLILNPAIACTVTIVAWTVAALNIVDLLDPIIALLDSAAINLGGTRLSVLTALNGIVLLAILLWLAFALSRTVEARVGSSTTLTPSARVLVSQFTKVTLITVAIVIALTSVGIDLTAFAVFTGALGVGIGFGLQKVVSNLLSGILLLMDKSVKPGDVIAIDNSYGWVKFMGARYVSLITRDGTEHLIPNENLITTRVENWSYSHDLLRLKTGIGVSYKSDVRKAIELAVEAAQETERVLEEPKPVCYITGFGDSSVDLSLRMWIKDPTNGIGSVRGAVLLKVWDKFHENGIEIPFPQRDLHIKSPDEIKVTSREP
jgi:small-conductance mechanosensitive channel